MSSSESSFSSAEAAKRLGVSRNTLLRWLRERRISEPNRDFRGWRRFTEADLDRIRQQLQGEIPVTHPPVSHSLQRSPPQTNPQSLSNPKDRSGQPTRDAAHRTVHENRKVEREASRIELLRQVPIFSSLTETDLRELDQVAEFKGYPRGTTIFHESQIVSGLHVLLKGRIKLVRLSTEGREQILDIVEPISSFASTALFDKRGRYLTMGRTCVVSSILTIPKSPLKRLIRNRADLAEAFLTALAERSKGLMRKVEEATFLTVDQRFARFIRENSHGGVIDNLNIGEVAAIIGAARESVSRALGRLSKAKIVSIKHGRLFIEDPRRLEQIA